MKGTNGPNEAEIAEYERRLARRAARRQQLLVPLAACIRYAFCLAVLVVVGYALDLVLACTMTNDGQQGNPLTAQDMMSGAPLAGVIAYAALVGLTWAIWHHPQVQRRRALRHAARARLAARIGPEHPLRQFRALHPCLSFCLRTLVIFELLQVVFGRVTPRRRP